VSIICTGLNITKCLDVLSTKKALRYSNVIIAGYSVCFLSTYLSSSGFGRYVYNTSSNNEWPAFGRIYFWM
jgi:hypothetical protein